MEASIASSQQFVGALKAEMKLEASQKLAAIFKALYHHPSRTVEIKQVHKALQASRTAQTCEASDKHVAY